MEHGVYLSGLKRALKLKGITYTDLASRLRMSESGVKKMLNGKDLSFRRVLQICEILGVPASELLAASEKAAIPEIELSEKQEEALLKDRRLLSVYWRFAIEKMDVSGIARVERMEAPLVRRLLENLVRLDLLVQRRGKFHAKQARKFRWRDGSKLVRVLNREWSQAVLKRALEHSKEDAPLHRLSLLRLSEASFARLRQDLLETLEDAARTSEREEAQLPEAKLFKFMALVSVAPGGPLD
jgi:transcriptional regulator with XRE-family HTH domain